MEAALAEVREFEPLTPCMSSTMSSCSHVRGRPDSLEIIDSFPLGKLCGRRSKANSRTVTTAVLNRSISYAPDSGGVSVDASSG